MKEKQRGKERNRRFMHLGICSAADKNSLRLRPSGASWADAAKEGNGGEGEVDPRDVTSDFDFCSAP